MKSRPEELFSSPALACARKHLTKSVSLGEEMRTLYSAILLVASFASAYAQQQKASEEFPSRSIRIIIPFEPGGATDFLARPWAAKMSESLGQSVVVENKGGANTILGTGEVARAQPDGYTLLIMPPNFLTNPALTTTMPYKTPQDFESVGLLVKYPQVLVARKEFPANNISELIALAKKDPNKITLASSGAGTQAHLSGELLMQMAGINLVHVPFKGAGPAISSLAGGHVAVLALGLASLLLAVTGEGLARWVEDCFFQREME